MGCYFHVAEFLFVIGGYLISIGGTNIYERKSVLLPKAYPESEHLTPPPLTHFKVVSVNFDFINAYTLIVINIQYYNMYFNPYRWIGIQF